MIRTVIESPFRGPNPEDIEANIRYARECVRDSLMRGEAPIASHLLHTQEGILDDDVPGERQLGMRAGFAWTAVAQQVAVYTDRGISNGMRSGIAEAAARRIPVLYRTIYADQVTDR